MDSGVPQGTMLGPCCSCAISTIFRVLSDHKCVSSRVTVFSAGRSTLAKTTSSCSKTYKIWAGQWGMKFNVRKCYITSLHSKSSHLYSLENHILKQVPSIPCLGVHLSENLSWSSVTENNSTTLCSEFSASLKPFAMNCDWRTPSFTNTYVNTCVIKCNPVHYVSLCEWTRVHGRGQTRTSSLCSFWLKISYFNCYRSVTQHDSRQFVNLHRLLWPCFLKKWSKRHANFMTAKCSQVKCAGART